MTEIALVWIVLTPLVGALAVLLIGCWPHLREAVRLFPCSFYTSSQSAENT